MHAQLGSKRLIQQSAALPCATPQKPDFTCLHTRVFLSPLTNPTQSSWGNSLVDKTASWLPFSIDLLLVSLIVLAGMLVADAKLASPVRFPWLQQDQRHHLGAEYGCVAQAIRTGRGFSDPFFTRTGPTAWVAPVLPYLLASVYWLSDDDRDVAIHFMLLLNSLAMLSAGCILVCEARRLRRTILGYLVLVGGLAANFHELFQKTHDSGLLLLLVSCLWIGSGLICNRAIGAWIALAWGVFGGLCALASPAIGGTWAVITAARLAPHSSAGRLPWMLVIATSILVVAPWTIRNRVVLGQWIPIKSNGMYELWQSQCHDDDGVLDHETTTTHPWPRYGSQRTRYLAVGEIAFVAERGKLARQAILAQPLDFLSRVSRRWVAMAVYYRPFRNDDRERGGGWPLLLKRLVFPLPLLATVMLIGRRQQQLESRASAAILVWVVSLLPYVLISYYDRYAVPLVGMKMLLVLYGMDSLHHLLKSYWRHRPSRTGQPSFSPPASRFSDTSLSKTDLI